MLWWGLPQARTQRMSVYSTPAMASSWRGTSISPRPFQYLRTPRNLSKCIWQKAICPWFGSNLPIHIPRRRYIRVIFLGVGSPSSTAAATGAAAAGAYLQSFEVYQSPACIYKADSIKTYVSLFQSSIGASFEVFGAAGRAWSSHHFPSGKHDFCIQNQWKSLVCASFLDIISRKSVRKASFVHEFTCFASALTAPQSLVAPKSSFFERKNGFIFYRRMASFSKSQKKRTGVPCSGCRGTLGGQRWSYPMQPPNLVRPV